MIEIELKLFATMRQYTPQSGDLYSVEDGATVESVITTLEIPKEEVKLIFVNGKQQSEDYVLADGDRLGLFPPVGGG